MGQALVARLQEGITVPGKPAGEAKFNARRAAEAVTLKSALDLIGPTQATEPPIFPERPGVTDVLANLPRFLVVAIFLLGTECVLPVALFWSRYGSAKRAIEQSHGRAKRIPLFRKIED